MIPAVAEEKLADYIDVFCDRGFFTVEQTERILEAGSKYGLVPKIHANELGLFRRYPGGGEAWSTFGGSSGICGRGRAGFFEE